MHAVAPGRWVVYAKGRPVHVYDPQVWVISGRSLVPRKVGDLSSDDDGSRQDQSDRGWADAVVGSGRGWKLAFVGIIVAWFVDAYYSTEDPDVGV